MNKPPQPITGPTSVPNPAPSPGLTQAAYGPGQPPSLVFATPAPPQMNSAQQPRPSYYPNRPAMATSAPRVQTSSGTRPVAPTHVYPPMMISQQQLSFAGSPQGYFIPPPGQYRAQYMSPAQQYPVTSGTAGYYPTASPAEYPAYAGAYYPAQAQYPPSVQPPPVMINPAQQQQQAPPPQQPPAQSQGPIKRERKQIRIRDPNQGGRDITEEIMSGGRSATTPTPPQTSIADVIPTQTNGEVTQPVASGMRRDENIEPPAGTETPPPTAIADTEAVVEVKMEIESNLTPPADLAAPCVATTAATEVPSPVMKDQQSPSSLPPAEPATTPAEEVNKVSTEADGTVDAAVGPSALLLQEPSIKIEELQAAPAIAEMTQVMEEKKMEEEKKMDKEQEACTKIEHVADVAATISSDEEEEETATKTAVEVSQSPPSEQEPATPQTQDATPSSTPEPEPTPAVTAEPLQIGRAHV